MCESVSGVFIFLWSQTHWFGFLAFCLFTGVSTRPTWCLFGSAAGSVPFHRGLTSLRAVGWVGGYPSLNHGVRENTRTLGAKFLPMFGFAVPKMVIREVCVPYPDSRATAVLPCPFLCQNSL